MDNIQELVRIVTTHKQKQIETFDLGLEKLKSSKYYKFYKFLIDHPGATDADCAAELCKCGPGDKKYLMVKSRLLRKLINTVYFFDIEKKDFSAYAKADFLCNKILSLSSILVNLGARKTLMQQVTKGFNTAIKFQMNRYAAEFTRILILMHSERGNTKEILQYMELNKKFRSYHSAENELLNFTSYIISHFTASNTQKPYLGNEIKDFIAYHENTKPIGIEECFMYSVQKYKFMLLYYQVMKDYSACIDYCDKIETLIRNSPSYFYNPKNLADTYMIKLNACMQLNEFHIGLETAEKYSKIVDKKKVGWLKLSEYYFIFLLKVQKYEEAYYLLNEVISNPNFNSRPENIKEKWHIFNYHLKYISIAGLGEQFNFKVNLDKIRPNKLLNDLEIFQKDKNGLYFSIVIIYFLLLIHYEMFNQYSDKVDSLRVFTSRRHKKGLDNTTVLFVKILLAIEKAEFKKTRAEKLGKNLFEKLLASRNTPEENALGIELIPYEILWENILKKLK